MFEETDNFVSSRKSGKFAVFLQELALWDWYGTCQGLVVFVLQQFSYYMRFWIL